MKKIHGTAVCITLASLILLISATGAFALKVGDTLNNVQIRDSNDSPTVIPDFGKKVIAVFYNDADVADQNDPAAEAIKAREFPPSKYRGIGVGNLKDAPWKPNSVIRMIARRKEQKFKSTILTDPDYILKNAWALGDCNEKSVLIIIDKSRQVIYYHKGRLDSAEIEKALAAIQKAIGQ